MPESRAVIRRIVRLTNWKGAAPSRAVTLVGSALLPCVLLSYTALPAARTHLPAIPDSLGAAQHLPNGLTYYVHQNKPASGDVELRLVVRAGSANETDDQRGAAFLVAHAALRGTAHFPADSLSAYLQSLGSLGVVVDTLVHTSYTTTVYHLTVAPDSAAVARGLALLADWARGPSFTSDGLDNVREIVISRLPKPEEHKDFADAFVDSIRAARRAVTRPVMGVEAALQARTPVQLDQFVHAWYRPDRMAVVIVGDMPPQQSARMLVAQFTALSASPPISSPSSSVATAPTAPSPGVAAVVMTDTSVSSVWVRVSYTIPQGQRWADAGLQAATLDPVYAQLLSQRLGAVVGRPGAHMDWATVKIRRDQSGSVVAEYHVQVQGSDGHAIDSATAAVVTEVARAGKHGFTAAEVAMVQHMSRQAGAGSPAAGQAEQYVRDFSMNGLTLGALQTRATQWAHANPLVVVGLPRHLTLQTAGAIEDVKKTVAAAQQQQLAPMTIDTSLDIVSLSPEGGEKRLAVVLQREVAKAKQSGRVPMIDLGAGWCGPCQMLNNILHQSRMRGMMQSMYVVQVDVDDAWTPSLPKGSIPVISAIGPNGQWIGAAGSLHAGDVAYVDNSSHRDDEWMTDFATSVAPDLADNFAMFRAAFRKH